MGNEAANPIYQRLTQALEAAAATDPANSTVLPDLAALHSETALRDWILRHHARLGLDPVWILTGVGKAPLPRPAQSATATPVFATTSIDPRTGHWRPLVRERVSLPAAVVSPGRFVIRMETRAMEPRLRLGAYLVVDEGQTGLPDPDSEQNPDQATPGPAFAVDVPGEGLVVRLARLDERQRLILTGLDPAAPPYCLPRQAGYRIVGRVVWVAQIL